MLAPTVQTISIENGKRECRMSLLSFIVEIAASYRPRVTKLDYITTIIIYLHFYGRYTKLYNVTLKLDFI